MSQASWRTDQLRQLAAEEAKARSQIVPVERAVLAYARWQGLTNESDIDPDAAKKTLDRLIDDMEPDQWAGMQGLVDRIEHDVLKGLMQHSMKRAVEQVQATTEPAPKPTRSRRRDKNR